MSNVLNNDMQSKLSWINEPEQWRFTDQGGIIIEAPIGADFFCDPAGKHIRSSAPFLSMPVGQSFEMTTQLTVDMQKKYDSGCLMLMADEKNWCKLCFEFNGEAATIVSVVTKDGLSDDCNSEEVQVANPYLKIRKVEDCVSFFYSADGDNWKLIRYFGMLIPSGGKAGIVAQSPQGIGSTVHFMNLIITEPEIESRF
ncbi:DUF1349 domain-containing protein [Paenibacillus alkalitolerans]|uniref:DUF1349 domain-containing protein n=1 Tax=Paenibacillus alkalitolerans TaxID=2799335 RepID=UPI0018F789CB|nr:DUF1349 domain-containing protein [Paenibacillus alkalitolerans]